MKGAHVAMQRFRVIGDLTVHDTEPGGEFEIDLDTTRYRPEQWLAAGLVEVVEPDHSAGMIGQDAPVDAPLDPPVE